MSTAPVTPAAAPLTLEQKLLTAASEAARIADLFSPVVANAIAGGVAVEPIFSGFIHMIAALFQHHASS